MLGCLKRLGLFSPCNVGEALVIPFCTFSLFQLTCQFTFKGIYFVCDLLGPSDNLKYEYITGHLIFMPQDTSGLFFIGSTKKDRWPSRKKRLMLNMILH